MTDTSTQSLLDRIDQLESRAAMRDLVSDYCHGFDKRDFERFLSIWTSDCVWNIGPPFGMFEGHSGIHKVIYEVLWPVWRESHHLTSNLKIRFENRDSAVGECDVDVMGATREDVVQVISATYSDRFTRSEGVWKIARRDVKMHFFNPLPGVQMTPPN